MKKKNKEGIIIAVLSGIIVFTVMIGAAALFVFPAAKKNFKNHYMSKKLEAGQTYLAQQGYKPAFTAFTDVFKIEKNNSRANIEQKEVTSGEEGLENSVEYEDTDAGTVEQRVYKDGAATQKQAVNITFNNGSGSKSDNSVRTANTGNTTNSKNATNTKNTKNVTNTKNTANTKNTVNNKNAGNTTNNKNAADTNTKGSSCTGKNKEDSVQGSKVVDNTDKANSNTDSVSGNAISGGGVSQDQEMESDDTVGGNAISGGEAPQDQEMDQEMDRDDQLDGSEIIENGLCPYKEIIDDLREEYGSIRLSADYYDPVVESLAELDGLCMVTLLDMDGMGELELFVLCKEEEDPMYRGIVYTIQDDTAVEVMNMHDISAPGIEGDCDCSVVIHRYNDRDFIVFPVRGDSGYYTICGYINNRFDTDEYSFDLCTDYYMEGELFDEEYDEDYDEDYDEVYDEEYDGESYDEIYDEEYDGESYDEVYDEEYDGYDGDSYDEYDDYDDSVDTYSEDDEDDQAREYYLTGPHYYRNGTEVDEETFTRGLAQYGLSLDESFGEDIEYLISGYIDAVQFDELVDLIMETEALIESEDW